MKTLASALAVLAVATAVQAADIPEAPAAQEAAADSSAAVQRTFDALKSCNAFFVATLDEGDQPRVRPFGALAMIDGSIYIQTGNFKPVFRQLTAHPRIEICALQPDGAHWLRLAATAVRVDTLEARQAVLDQNPSLSSLYSADDGRCEVFRLEDVTATFNGFGGEPETLKF